MVRRTLLHERDEHPRPTHAYCDLCDDITPVVWQPMTRESVDGRFVGGNGVREVRDDCGEGVRPGALGPRRLLPESVVVVTDDSGDPPSTVCVLPKVHKLCLTDRLRPLPPWMMESMNTNLNRTVAMHRIHLERP
jgi:hypothetical protein